MEDDTPNTEDDYSIPPDVAMYNRQEHAATKIQSLFRGYLYRYNISRLDLQNFCARKIQRAWTRHLMRQRLQRCKEIIALKVLTHAIQIYRRRKHSKAKMEHLKQYDPILSFYPSKTKKATPSPYTKPANYKPKKGEENLSSAAVATASTLGRAQGLKLLESQNNKGKRNGNKKGKTQSKGGKSDKSKSASIPAAIPATLSLTTAPTAPKVRMKRKYLVELPPPWHEKDPRRLAASVKEEMMYDQKGNIQWVKSDILPLFIKEFSNQLDLRDELTIKNEKYKNRVIPKIFLSPIARNTKELRIKNPQDVAFIHDSEIYVFCSNQKVAMLDLSGFSDDTIVYSENINTTLNFNTDPTIEGENESNEANNLLDIAIDHHSGHLVGIDSLWRLHLFEKGKVIISYQLKVEKKIPSATKFLTFDHFGLLWVNLFSQKGPLLCFDPITLQVNTQVNLENIRSVHRNITNIVYLSPLHIKEQPYGFVALITGSYDVLIFSSDFHRCKRLHNNDLNSFPNVKQVGQRIVVWSDECMVYIYELKEQIELINCTAKFTVKSRPLDICGINEPDLLVVSCEDMSIRCYLAKGTEFPMRVPNQNLTHMEASFANRLLGPLVYTKSRGAFKEMICYKFSYQAYHIDSLTITDKLSCILTAFSNGDCGSFWIYNDNQMVKVSEFDSFQYYEPLSSQAAAVDQYNQVVVDFQRKGNSFKHFYEFLNKFDQISNRGELSNIFLNRSNFFNLPDLINHNSYRLNYSFIPEPPQFSLTSYDAFHFLIRSGILPKPVSTFSGFLTRFANESEQKVLPPEPDGLVNQMIPIKTKGLYNAIVDISFTTDEIVSIIERINPLHRLRENLPIYTISTTTENMMNNEKGEKGAKESTQRKWTDIYEKQTLVSKLNALSMMEDMVKHELMRRVQEIINKTFYKNLLDKMQPVTSIDIHSKVNLKNGTIVAVSTHPHRNPLLDENRHISIYEQWSKYSMFGKDKGLTIDLEILHIPHETFSRQDVAAHFDLARHISIASKYTKCEVYNVTENQIEEVNEVALIKNSRALPLSHYLTIHSYLGANSRLLLAARSIMGNILTCLYQLHKNGVVMRTLSPDNVLLNPQDGSICIGSLWDCQTSSVYLPLPDQFANPMNPSLPPEFYYQPMSEYTTAFDIWQFGILLLYVLTGFQPQSYGSELIKHVSKGKDGLYPRCHFFYDWLKGAKIIQPGESVIGQRGECFISTDRPGEAASILELDSYMLLPYKNTKLNYDESRLFIEIIASCLQIDPKKRPTAEELLRTYPFNQTNQTGDILENYMKNPNPNVFVAQFFAPVLSELNDMAFPFALGIISALLFADENNPDDMKYAFPLDSRANNRVIKSLFTLKFIDKLVEYVIDKIESSIQLSDVIPTITYKNALFDSLIHFFMRYVAAVELGQGNLFAHIDDIGMSLLSLYAGNPHLKRNSSFLLASNSELSHLIKCDSAPLYIFTYNRVHALVRYSLQYNSYVFNNLTRTKEHDDNYFNQFLTFSEAVFNFATAMCHSIEKQRTNAIKTMASLWANQSGNSTLRLFIDFRVPQKVLHCFHIQCSRAEAASFLLQALNSTKIKSHFPIYAILRQTIKVPTLLPLCSIIFRSTGNDTMKPPCLEIIRNIFFDESKYDVISLIISDVIWSIVEMNRDPLFFTLLQDSITQAPSFFLELIKSSQFLQKALVSSQVEIIPKIDPRVFEDNLDLNESKAVLKKLTGYFLLTQGKLSVPIENVEPISIKKCTEFIKKVINMALKEADGVAKFADTQLMKETRFEIKENNFMKSKSKAKEMANSVLQSTINEVSSVLINIMKYANYYFMTSRNGIPNDLFEMLKTLLFSQIPMCDSMTHPAIYLLIAFQHILLNAFKVARPNPTFFNCVSDFPKIFISVFRKDNNYIQYCTEKDIFEVKLMERYTDAKNLRSAVFKTFVKDSHVDCTELFQIILLEMIHSSVVMKGNYSFQEIARMQCPLRYEAVEMISFVILNRDVYWKKAQQIVQIMIDIKFLDKERLMTEKNDHYNLVLSSIDLLTILSNAVDLFPEDFVQTAQAQIESLKMRFVRKWNNSFISDQIENINNIMEQKMTAQLRSARVGKTGSNPRATTQLMTKPSASKLIVKPKNGKSVSAMKLYKHSK